MTKPGGDPNATRPCVLCKQPVPRCDWSRPPHNTVCDTCARQHQRRPTIRVVGYPNHFKHYVAGVRVPRSVYRWAYRRLEP